MFMLCTLVHVHCAPFIGTVIFSLRLWMNVWFFFLYFATMMSDMLLLWSYCPTFRAVASNYLVNNNFRSNIYMHLWNQLRCAFLFCIIYKIHAKHGKNRLLLWNSQSTLNRGDNTSYDKRWLAPWDGPQTRNCYNFHALLIAHYYRYTCFAIRQLHDKLHYKTS